MFKTLSLVLPVLIPSWSFFQSIEPSPRVQWVLRASNTDKSADWHEFHPRPATVGALQMMMRLFWNPDRNEELFVVSCAERIQLQPTAHSINEIRRRILPEIEKRSLANPDTYFQFRLVFVHRDQNDLVQEVVFLSDRFATVDPQS